MSTRDEIANSTRDWPRWRDRERTGLELAESRVEVRV
jgi:hypothetical protein